MKTLILVDDELIARQHIKESFPWQEWGYTIVGEATNGEEALALIEALLPDIALIDITMPVMDGLTLLKHMNSRSSHTKCVILTAHRDFSYVKLALENGASGYILKSPVDLAETKAALDKALSESEKESQVRSFSQSQITIQNNRYPLRKHFFQQLLTGLYANDSEITQQGYAIGAQLEAPHYLLLIGEADSLSGFHARYSDNDRTLIEFSMLEMIRESLHSVLSVHTELFPLQFGRVAILLSLREQQSDKGEYMEVCQRIEQALQVPLKKYLDLTLKMAASEPFNWPKLIRNVYKQTDRLLIHSFYQEKSKIIFSDGLQSFYRLSPEQWSKLNEFTAHLSEAAGSEAALKGINNILSYLVKFKPTPSDVVAWLIEMESHLRQAAHLPAWPHFLETESVYKNVSLLQEWLQSRDHTIASALAVRPEIARAIKHIQQHLGDELTLENISVEAGLSTSHFSHLFKKEIGKSVIDYVLEQRIELAKSYLLEGKFRNYELAEKVGFQHYSYFSNMFKKITGMSPNEYKRSVNPIITS
ncbi:MAG: response regulator [Gorillibacterium sp.]|nr:response regulator [Gorillibacterium sp.]